MLFLGFVNTRAYFTKLNNAFHGIIAIPLLVFVYLYLEFDSGNLSPITGKGDYLVLTVLFNAASIVYFVRIFIGFRKAVNAFTDEADLLAVRLQRYSNRSIQFYLAMSIPGVAAIILMILTGELGLSFVYVAGLFLLSVKRPSVHVICKDLHLTGEERQMVLKKKEIPTAG